MSINNVLCFAPCPEATVKAGQCPCHNRINAIPERQESKLEQAALDNCVCKTGDCVHYNSFIRGANWQSLTTPARNEEWGKGWDSAITVANNLCIQFSDDYNSDDQITEADIANKCAIRIRKLYGDRSYKPEKLFPESTPSKPHTVEAGQTQEPVDQYEVYKEEKGMLHGWYRSDPIEYEKYPDDKRRIVSTPPPAPIKTEALEIKSIQEVMNLDSFINTLRHNSPPNDSLTLLQEHFWAAVDAIQKAITPPIKTEGEDERKVKEDIAKIIRDNIFFSGQVGGYVIHGAIEKIIEYFITPLSVNMWVKAENNPPVNGYYICWCKDNDKGLIHYHKDTGWQNGFYDELVTHWMYLIPPDQFTPPPSPVGIDVEALAKEYAEKIIDMDWRPSMKMEDIITDFKAGYSASLNNKNNQND